MFIESTKAHFMAENEMCLFCFFGNDAMQKVGHRMQIAKQQIHSFYGIFFMQAIHDRAQMNLLFEENATCSH